jgi:hypothetical protein
VPVAETREALRRNFTRWGCPQRLRVDNGIPWGTPGGLPSELSLWAVGLGVPMHWNDPYSPEENGVVESTQGTSQRWVDPSNCANFAELCLRTQQEDQVQREHYPSINGLSRRQAYPALLHSGRGYNRLWEEQVWDVQEALRFLGRYRVRRKVSGRGQVSVYHRLIRASAERAGEWVYVQMDAQTVEWVISDVAGQPLWRRPAPQFTAEAIRALDVAREWR